MIWERCRREAPATGLGRSLFTPLPRHVSVFDCEARSVIYSWKVESGKVESWPRQTYISST